MKYSPKVNFYLFLLLVSGENQAQGSRRKRKWQNFPPPYSLYNLERFLDPIFLQLIYLPMTSAYMPEVYLRIKANYDRVNVTHVLTLVWQKVSDYIHAYFTQTKRGGTSFATLA